MVNPSHSQPLLREKCGIFGVYGKGFEAARLTYFGLFALQHRGQESSGITASDGVRLTTHKGDGLVPQVYKDEDISALVGTMAIGHNRYSTSKGGGSEHAQPVVDAAGICALAHNGNLPSTQALEEFLARHKVSYSQLNDSGMMAAAVCVYLRQGASLEEAIRQAYPLFTGAFSLLVMTKDKIAALRDPCGIRPLSIGKLNGGYVFASETCALDTVHATFLQDVQAGEMVVVDSAGLHVHQLAPANQKLDIFEFIYFSRPDSVLLGQSVDAVRQNFGRRLAAEYPVSADLVVGVPDSATPAALGYAAASGIPYYPALIKNRYIGRTFIRPEQHLRDWDVQMKLNPVKHMIEGKRVVVIDDSLVRGTTSKRVVALLRHAGAKEVHFLVSSPPYRYPDFYGIDTPSQNQLIAATKSVEETADYLGADSLYYLSYEGLIAATGLPESHFSTTAFTGVYPIAIGERNAEIITPFFATV